MLTHWREGKAAVGSSGGHDQRADAVRLCALSAGLVLIALHTAGFSQGQETVDISVGSTPRPVAAAVLQTEQHFGYVVTYEDVTYMHPGDIVDVTEQVRRDARSDSRVFGVRSGTIGLSVTPRPATIDAQVGEVLNEIIARSRAAGNTGDYRAERVDGGYHVIPIAATWVVVGGYQRIGRKSGFRTRDIERSDPLCSL